MRRHRQQSVLGAARPVGALMARSYWQPQIVPARVALDRGGFRLEYRKWAHKGRRYGYETIKKLIDNGEAVRIGNRVVKCGEAA
jgi:hypothetical protein